MKKFVVVGRPRTGSTLLLTGLGQHPHICAFGELFHQVLSERESAHAIQTASGKISFDDRSEDAIAFLNERAFPNADPQAKAVGFKLFAEHVKCRGTERLFTRLKDEIPGLKVIHIVRDNYLDVLVSRSIAMKTREWVIFSNQCSSHKRNGRGIRIRLDPEKARGFFDSMKQSDTFFSRFFGGEHYMKITYSDLSKRFVGEIQRAYSFLDVKKIFPVQKTERQSRKRAVKMVENFAELKKAFEGSEYEVFFGT